MIPWYWRERLTTILSVTGKDTADVDLEALVDDIQQAEAGLEWRRALRLFPSNEKRLNDLSKIRRAASGLIKALLPDGTDQPPHHILGALLYQQNPAIPSESEVVSTLTTLIDAAGKIERWSKEACGYLEHPPSYDPKIEVPGEKPETWLVGGRLPEIYEKHFGKWPVSKSNGIPGGAGIAFVQACAGMMGVEATPDMIDVYRRRSNRGHPPQK